jgi:hypothetical protein
MSETLPSYIVPVGTERTKAVSWPAVFGGTFVALATELLFAAFGLFIGFTLSSPGGIGAWAKIWYFITAFFALLIGGWTAARLSTTAVGSGRMHAAITWGLTTMATFAFAIWMSWGALQTTVTALRTGVVAANTTAATSTPGTLAQGEASRMKNEAAAAAAQTANQAPQIATDIKSGASTLFLVLFGGILCGCVGALVGGSAAGKQLMPAEPAPVA